MNTETAAIVSRETSKGLLLVSVVNGKIVATLAGKLIGSDFGTMPKAIVVPAGKLTHHVGVCALFAPEAALIASALDASRKAYLATPAGRRAEFVAALCETDAFPGSKAWNKANAARNALAAFDLAHPEVLAASMADHDASIATSGCGCGGGL